MTRAANPQGRRLAAAMICGLLVHASFAYAFAGDGQERNAQIRHGDADDESADFDSALEAVKAGKALPLSTLQKTVMSRFHGEMINVEINRKQEQLFYEFKVLRPSGHVTEVEINAMTGKIEEVEND
jgi:uncharacterized membrane protein YkoI